MKWAFELIAGRVYFYLGLSVILYSVASNAIALPLYSGPAWLTTMLIGLLLMMIGTQWVKNYRASSVKETTQQ